MNFVISQQLAQAILNFLGTQPYAQVFPLVEGLKNVQPITPEPPTELPDEVKIERVK